MSDNYIVDAKRILAEAGFPLEKIEIRLAAPARSSSAAETAESDGSLDREALVDEIKEVMSDGEPRRAKDIAAKLVQRGYSSITKRDVNSILFKEGKGAFTYDSETYQYTLKR